MELGDEELDQTDEYLLNINFEGLDTFTGEDQDTGSLHNTSSEGILPTESGGGMLACRGSTTETGIILFLAQQLPTAGVFPS